MFSLRPLPETAGMIPKPMTTTTPMMVHVAPIRARIPIFQRAARTLLGFLKDGSETFFDPIRSGRKRSG